MRSVNTAWFANETNVQVLYGVPNPSPHVKDAFHEAVVRGNAAAINPEFMGTKAAAHYRLSIGPSESRLVRLRLQRIKEPAIPAFDDFDQLVAQRREEADEFYGALTPSCLSSEHCAIQRQALAGMLSVA